jgi:hypothetical protein
MRYERDDMCRVRGSRLRKLIKEKYGKLMGFYAMAAKMCRVSEQAIHMFLGCGRMSQKKHGHTILTMLGIKDGDFDTYFIGGESSLEVSPSLAGTSPVIPLLHAIIDRLNGLEEKIDKLSHMVRISQKNSENH